MRVDARVWAGSVLSVCALVACSSTATSTSTPRASGPATVSATPEASSTYADRRLAKLSIANADGMVAVAGALFVKTDDGRVVRVDPGTNKVAGEVMVDTATSPDHYCQGIGTDGTPCGRARPATTAPDW